MRVDGGIPLNCTYSMYVCMYVYCIYMYVYSSPVILTVWLMGSFPSFLSNECSSLWSMAACAKKWVTYLNGGGSQRQLGAAVLVFTILVVI